jgi:hypothetical protein
MTYEFLTTLIAESTTVPETVKNQTLLKFLREYNFYKLC